jgi:hypothetical protein
MEQTFWEKINNDLGNTYYTIPVVIISSLLVIITGIKLHLKEKSSILFIIYSLCCLILFVGSELFKILYQYKASTSRIKIAILQSGNTLFALIELFIFYYYYSKITKLKFMHLAMKFSFILFLAIVFVFFLKLNDKKFEKFYIHQFSALIATIEFFLLLLPIFVYLFELFKNESIKEIKQSPSFWVNSGLFIYILVTLPFLIISESIRKPLYYFMYSLHFVSLSILLLTITKAFLCRKPIIT